MFQDVTKTRVSPTRPLGSTTHAPHHALSITHCSARLTDSPISPFLYFYPSACRVDAEREL